METRHYRWVICLCGAILMFVTGGLSLNVFTVYVPYIIAENGFTHTQGSLLTTSAAVTSLASLFLLRRYYRIFGYRRGLALSVFCLAAGYYLFWQAGSFPVYCISSALGGLSCGLGCIVPLSMVLDRWFTEHRGLATGLCSAGCGLATVIMPPVIASLVRRHGLQTAFLTEAVLVTVLGVLFVLFFRDTPPGWQAEEETVRHSRERRLDRGGRIALLTALILLGGVCNVGFSHLTVLYTTAGWSDMTVAWAITAVGFVTIVSKLLYGEATDRHGAYRTNLIFGGLLLMGMALCCLPKIHSPLLMMGAMFGIGMGLPLTNVSFPIWARDLSPGDMAQVMRMLQMGYFIGKVLFSALPGQLADLTGSYAPAYLIFVFFTGIFLFILQTLYRRNRMCKAYI